MKKIAIIYRDCENIDAIEYIRDAILEVFDGYADAQNYFLTEIGENEIIKADAYLVLYEEMLYALTAHIHDFSSVIIISRSIQKRYLSMIMDIPQGTEVLVVNDSRESTLQTTYLIYELGISHLSLIPFDERLHLQGGYDHIDTAITTPKLDDAVPSHIKHIVNIQYRDVNFDTLFRLMRILDLEVPTVQRNLLRRIHKDAEPNIDSKSNYLQGYLKEQMINRIIQSSTSAILLLDNNFKLAYSNDCANSILQIDSKPKFDVFTFAPKELLSNGDFIDQLINISGVNYLMEKLTITLLDETVGYYIALQNEKTLRDHENNLSNQLKKRGLYAKYHFDDIVHQSETMQQCIAVSKKAALTDYTILIRGESGTGKELLAQSIHNHSSRQRFPFVAVNCAALPESLLESELFGYEKGSFTGAHKSGKVGLFEQAQRGTIFLDEIGDISPGLQSRLLRVIQERQIMRIGSDKVIDVNVRIIAATNTHLEQLILDGKFRQDLFYRLNVLSIPIAPLRERLGDILPLLKSFLGLQYDSVSAEDQGRLLNYSWPGNVRQLENVASYFKTLDTFPPYIHHEETPMEKVVSPIPTVFSQIARPLDLEILSIINLHSQVYHGIGRAALLTTLAQQNIHVGDAKLRTILAGLADQGLITIGLGRTGTQITQAGIVKITEK